MIGAALFRTVETVKRTIDVLSGIDACIKGHVYGLNKPVCKIDCHRSQTKESSCRLSWSECLSERVVSSDGSIRHKDGESKSATGGDFYFLVSFRLFCWNGERSFRWKHGFIWTRNELLMEHEERKSPER